MAESFDQKTPQEQSDYHDAICRIDPSQFTLQSFVYFFRRLDEVRNMPEDEVPDDTSDAWVFKDPRYEVAFKEHHEKFLEAADALAMLIAAERDVYHVEKAIRRDVNPMLIARYRISQAADITTEDFNPSSDAPSSLE